MRPKLKEYPTVTIVSRTSARIRPHRLEIYLPAKLGDCPSATQKGNAFSPQPGAMKDAFLFWVDHGSRPDVCLGARATRLTAQIARVAPDWPVPSLMHGRRVMGDRITYVRLDVHQQGVVVVVPSLIPRHAATRRGSAGTRLSLRVGRKFDAMRIVARPIDHKAMEIK